MEILKNRAFALALTVVLIASSVWLGGYRSLTKLKNEVETAFTAGVDGDGFSIANDLEKVASESYNLYTVASKCGCDEGAMKSLLSARDALISADGAKAKFAALSVLSEREADLYADFKTRSASDQQKKLAAQFHTEILSRVSTISNDGYNAAAADFNKKLTRFPVSLISMITGVGGAEVFG